MSDLYKKAGVNIEKGNEVIKRIKGHVASTHTKAVLKNIGSFGGLFELTDIVKKYKKPVLVQSIDGVGTKLSVAKMMNKYDTVGQDIVNHSCNDVLAMGATPITFLDYVANEKLIPSEMEAIVKGMSEACREAGVALIGGETAEMPGTYTKGEHDIAGCITGVVEKGEIITGENIKENDLILGFASNGLHTNGYSLARKLLFSVKKHSVNTQIKELGCTVGEALLKVHINYMKPVLQLLDKGVQIKGIAHITGGGFIENIPRVLPANLDAEIKKGSWPILPIFSYMQKIGNISEREMYKAFNMGIGLMIVVKPEQKEKIEKILIKQNKNIFWVGKIIKGTGKTVLI
ncbi:MAG: phosphoribosylformylglycinamidine cyclo-ligase [Candidatus Pacebacteria bacterium]|nr:phosphoribosylformylglycinamidine cyclo-ligase [Candidatus Paceibacterota bacterium]